MAVEYFQHFLIYELADLITLPFRQLVGSHVEQVVVQVKILQHHFRMEDIFLIYVDVYHIITAARTLGNVVLDGINAVIDEQLLAAHVAGKAADMVVEGYDVGVEIVNQVIQRVERRNTAARRYVDIGAESHDPLLRMAFRIRMNRQMALIQMTNYVGIGRFDRLFRNEDGHAGPLGIVILAGNIQNICADNRM